jgi:hypothetical protein
MQQTGMVAAAGEGQEEGGMASSSHAWLPTSWKVGLSTRHHDLPCPDRSTTLEELGLLAEEGDEAPMLYVTMYGAREGFVAPMGRGLEARPAWVPRQCPKPTEAGMACFLSSLYMICHKVCE